MGIERKENLKSVTFEIKSTNDNALGIKRGHVFLSLRKNMTRVRARRSSRTKDSKSCTG
jgi:hypothetical protein